jgi:hypothetical protein
VVNEEAMTLRPESSVSVEMDEYGELVFAGDRPGPVIHRTPEELGIPRVIKAPKPIEKAAVDIRAARAEAQKLQRDVEQRRKATAGPSAAVAARPPLRMTAKCEEDGSVANELKEKVLAEPDLPVDELAKKTGASKQQIYNWRYEVRKKAGSVATPKQPKQKKAKPASTGLQRVTIDPQRPGTAAALIGAPARRDAASAVTVRLELTEGEVASLIGRLSDAQRTAFLAAGVKAAILG